MAGAIDHLEVRWRPTDSTGAYQTQSFAAGTTQITLPGVTRGGQYTVEARNVGPNGLASAWVAVTHTVSSASQLPQAPTALLATPVADGVYLSWSVSQVDRADVQYQIDVAPDVSGSPGTFSPLTTVRSFSYTHGVTDGVTRWYRVSAVDFTGLQSGYTSNVNSKGKTVANGADVSANYVSPLIPNPGFENGDDGNWGKDTGWTIGQYGAGTQTNGTWSGRFIGYSGASSGKNIFSQTYIPCAPGQQLIASCAVMGTSGSNSSASIFIAYYNASKAWIGVSSIGNGVTATGAWNISRIASTVPAGAAYYAIGASSYCTSGTYYVDAFVVSQAPSTLDEVPDSSTYFKTTGNGPWLIDNNDFEAGTNANPPAGWQLGQNGLLSPNNGTAFGGAYTGTRSLQIFSSSQQYCGISSLRRYAVNPGEQYKISAATYASSVANSAVVDIGFFNASGAGVGSIPYIGGTAGGWTYGSASGTVPAGAVYAMIRCYNNNVPGVAQSWAFDCISVVRISNLDSEVYDGSTYGRIKQSSIMSGTGVPFTGAYSANMCSNGNFMRNQVGTSLSTQVAFGGWVGDCWKWDQCDIASGNFAVSLQNGGLVSGVNNLAVSTQWGGNFPNGTYGCYVHDQQLTPINPKDSVIFSAQVNTFQAIAFPNGNANATVGVDYFDKNMAYLGGTYKALSATGGVQYVTVRGNPPANVCWCRCVGGITLTNNGSTFSPGSNSIISLLVTNIRLVLCAQTQADLPQIAVTNLNAKLSGQSVTYTAAAGSPATATISSSAFTAKIGSIQVGYNSASVGVSGTGGTTVTYYLYADDPNYVGGSITMVATTNGDDIYAADGRMSLGACQITFPTSGTGGGSGGGGGGGWCVDEMSYLPDGRQALLVNADDLLFSANETNLTPSQEVVREASSSLANCVRIHTAGHVTLVCTEDAPLPTHDGYTLAKDALNSHVAVKRIGNPDHWQQVIAVEPVGKRRVRKIDLNDKCFWAGEKPDEYILHHNQISKP